MTHLKDAQLILVMNELDAINFRKKGFEKPGCKVIAFDSEFLDSENPLIASLKKENLLVENNVLVKSPKSSDDKYYRLEDASQKIHTDYFKQYSAVLALLGATSVEVKECSVVAEKKKSGGGGGIIVPTEGGGVSGGVSGERGTNHHVQELMKLHDSFSYRLDLAGAKRLIEAYSLQKDKELADIITAIENGILYKEHDFNLSLSKDMQSLFKLAANITHYAGIDIKSKMESHKDISETYNLHIHVIFNNSSKA